MLLVKVLLASWWQQWSQLLLVIFGLLTASAGLSSVLALNETAKQKMSQLDTSFAGKPRQIATLEDGRRFEKSDYASLLNLGWQVVGLSRFVLASHEQEIHMVAMDVSALLTQTQIAKHKGSQSHQKGSQTTSTASKSMDISVWQSLLASPDTVKEFQQYNWDKSWNLPKPLPLPQIKDNNIYLSMSLAGTWQHHININELWIYSQITKKQAQILSEAGFDIKLMTSDTGTLTDSFYINITAMGLLMFSVSMFISLNAYNLLFSGRKTLIRQLYLAGVDIGRLHLLFAVESNLLTFLCCTLGFALGLALAELISPGMELTLRNLYDARFTERDVSFWQVWLTVLIAGLVAANLILWFPLKQSLKQLDLTDNAPCKWHRLAASIRFFRDHSLSISVAVLLLLIISQQLLSIDSLLFHFVLITGCVLCGCIVVLLLVPKILTLIRRIVPPEHPLMYYFSADAVRLSDRSQIAVCAFFIAITANIGMNLMVGSFRQATDNWIEQQFVADFYLSTNDTTTFNNWSAAQTNLNVYHRARSEIAFESRKTEVLPMPVDFSGHLPLLFKNRLFKKEVTDAQRLKADSIKDNHIFINEQMSIRHQLHITETIQLGEKNYVVAGIYYDYGNMFNQVLVPPTTPDLFDTDDNGRQLFSVTLQDKNKKALEDLKSELEQLPVSYFSGQQIKEISMRVFEQTFVITSGLNLITLLVAGASLATSILIIESQNNQQTRILRQMGISDGKIWFGSLLQYGYLISLVFCLSVPFGILLSYQLINHINYAAFQWSYPLQHELISYGFVYLIALLTVLLAVSLPLLVRKVFSRGKLECIYG